MEHERGVWVQLSFGARFILFHVKHDVLYLCYFPWFAVTATVLTASTQ